MTPSACRHISGGVRFEDHPLSGSRWSPRGGVVFQPAPRHALRASYSKAYRVASYLESYWQQEAAVVLGLTQLLRGSLDIEPEEIDSVELGYQGLLRDELLVNLAVFSNNVNKLIDLEVVAETTSPPAPFDDIPSELAFLNDDDWRARGVEIEIRADPTAAAA